MKLIDIEDEMLLKNLFEGGRSAKQVIKLFMKQPEVKAIPKVYYICDGKACDHCDNDDCHLTEKIEHAINFKKGDVNDYIEKCNPYGIPIQWLKNYDRDLADKLIKDYNKSLELVSPFNDN